MLVEFEKWHGLENDFIVCWSKESLNLAQHLAKVAPRICHRHVGIGADGIIVLYENPLEPKANTFPFFVINQDGSFAKNCGNGLRCAAASYFRKQQKNPLLGREGNVEVLFTLVGKEFLCQKVREASEDFYYISVLMPLGSGMEEGARVALEQSAQKTLAPYNKEVEATCRWVQNPHVVLKCLSTKHFNAPYLENLAKLLPAFNCHLVQEDAQIPTPVQKASDLLQLPLESSVTALCYEHGVGFTQACGSGACAIAENEFASGLIAKDQWVAVNMPGGTLWVKQGLDEEFCTLLGSANFVFKGQLML